MKSKDVLVLLKKLTPEVNFKIKPKENEELKYVFSTTLEKSYLTLSEELEYTLKSLEEDLKGEKKKLKQLKSAFKKGKISLDKLSNQEIRVIDLNSQISYIKSQINSINEDDEI